MYVHVVQIINKACFLDSKPIELSPNINILIGKNNSGKTAFLKALGQIQQPGINLPLRLNANSAGIVLYEVKSSSNDEVIQSIGTIKSDSVVYAKSEINKLSWGIRPNLLNNITDGLGTEGNQQMFTFAANRSHSGFGESINTQTATDGSGSFASLAARVLQLRDVSHDNHERFMLAMKEILGLDVRSLPSLNGISLAIKPKGSVSGESIGITQMGDGTAHILNFIATILSVRQKIILIDQPESDLHPEALKLLCNLIAEASKSNQFVITTHSNIVVRSLAGVSKAKLFDVSMEIDPATEIPTSTITEVGKETESRLIALEKLGYDASDYWLWKGWLFLEESSAESIITKFLIPNFAEKLDGKLRTVSSGGISKVRPKFDDFHRMFLFAHLEETYKKRAWVVVDGDEPGIHVINEMKKAFSQWPPENFVTLSQKAFEFYYPDRFSNKVQKALALPGKSDRKQAKKALLEEVLDWCQSHPSEARAEFKSSAMEIITLLKKFEASL